MQSIKGSANREEYKGKPKFSLNFRGAAYLGGVASKLRLSERKTKENTFSFDFPNVSNLDCKCKGTIKLSNYQTI